MRFKASARSKPWKLTMVPSIPDFNLQETGTEKVRQVWRASHPVATYAEIYRRACELFFTIFCDGESFVAQINGYQFQQTVLDWLCESRSCCFVVYHNPICSWGSHIFSQFRDGKGNHSSRGSKVLPLILDRETHWHYCAKKTLRRGRLL